MTGKGTSFVCAVVSLSLFAGCVGVGYGLPLSDSRANVFPHAAVATFLLAAGDEDDEFVGLLTQPTPPEPPPEPPAERAGRFGVRAGLLVPTGAEEGTWSAGVRAGLYFRGGRSTAYELGFDYTSLEADFGKGTTVSSAISSLRCDVLFGRWSGDDRKATFYFLGGGEVGQESGTWGPTGDTLEPRGGGVNLGLGVGSPKGSWDARVVYTVLAGTDNAAGTVLAAFGYSF